MKKMKIEIVRAVDEDNLVTDLFAIEAGTRPNFGVVTKAVYELLGDYQDDSDEELYRNVIDTICDRQNIGIFRYTLFFVELELYVN